MNEDARWLQLTGRLDRLRRILEDEREFARVVSTGRYLKLCSAIQAVQEALENR